MRSASVQRSSLCATRMIGRMFFSTCALVIVASPPLPPKYKRCLYDLGKHAGAIFMLKMSIAYQEWPYRQTFTFARETRESAPLFVVHMTDGTHIGRGECGIQS